MRTQYLALALTIAALGAVAPTQAEAQQRGYARTATTVSFRVPSIVKLVADQTARTSDGAPVIRVITNDPALRAALANGVTPEVVRLAATAQEHQVRAKGGEATPDATDGTRVVRYTVVTP